MKHSLADHGNAMPPARQGADQSEDTKVQCFECLKAGNTVHYCENIQDLQDHRKRVHELDDSYTQEDHERLATAYAEVQYAQEADVELKLAAEEYGFADDIVEKDIAAFVQAQSERA